MCACKSNNWLNVTDIYLDHDVKYQTKATSPKKIQWNVVILLNRRAYAKIQALLKEKKFHPKKSLQSVLHQAIQLGFSCHGQKFTDTQLYIV